MLTRVCFADVGALILMRAKGGRVLEYNHYLENLETELYARLQKLLAENRYQEMEQVVSIMQKVGIV